MIQRINNSASFINIKSTINIKKFYIKNDMRKINQILILGLNKISNRCDTDLTEYLT